MPELPEVEHVVRALAPIVVGRRILAAELNLKRIAPGISRPAFNRQLRDSLITSIGRRGKYILFQLESGHVLATHLRMTGKFVSLGADQSLPPYAHVVFYLDDEKRLVFCDMRQFGRMRILPRSSEGTRRPRPRAALRQFHRGILSRDALAFAPSVEAVAVGSDTRAWSRKHLRCRSVISRRRQSDESVEQACRSRARESCITRFARHCKKRSMPARL